MTLKHLTLIRYKCKKEAIRMNYSLELFNRIPMYFFTYFSIDNVLDNVQLNQMYFDILVIFMLINKIDAALMTAFFSCGGQIADMCIRIYDVFFNAWNLFNTVPKTDHMWIFSDRFSYHLETKTLRRIDMSIVSTRRNNNNTSAEYFVPNHVSWRRYRQVRQDIRCGIFKIDSYYDLILYKEVHVDSVLMRRGRYKSKLAKSSTQ